MVSTPGAIRAAKSIHTRWPFMCTGPCLDREKHHAEEDVIVAEIIDRETGAVELRQSLELAHRYFIQSNKLTAEDREVLDDMWLAIQKARGRQ